MAENNLTTETVANGLAAQTVELESNSNAENPLMLIYSDERRRVRNQEELGNLILGDLERAVVAFLGDRPVQIRQSSWRKSVIGEGEKQIVIEPMVGITSGFEWSAKSRRRADNPEYFDIAVHSGAEPACYRLLSIDGLPRGYSLIAALKELQGYSKTGEPKIFYINTRQADSTTADAESPTAL